MSPSSPFLLTVRCYWLVNKGRNTSANSGSSDTIYYAENAKLRRLAALKRIKSATVVSEVSNLHIEDSAQTSSISAGDESRPSGQSVSVPFDVDLQELKAQWEKFNPKEYIHEYYSALGSENRFLLDFFHRTYANVVPGASILEFGGGPTIYQLISASQKASEIVFAEYLNSNRAEVQEWIQGRGKHDKTWDSYVAYVLGLVGKEQTAQNISQAKQQLRSKVTDIVECDAYLPELFLSSNFRLFDVVASNFCIECINGSEQSFLTFVSRICRRVKPGGLLVLTMLKNSNSFKVANRQFPAFPVDEAYMRELLRKLKFSQIEIESTSAEHEQGYEGIFGIRARRPS